jgi:hypothetical protein
MNNINGSFTINDKKLEFNNYSEIEEFRKQFNVWIIDYMKSIDTYDRQLWKYALDLYRGGDPGVFITDFVNAISNQLNRAWREGAGEMGVAPADMTDDDRNEIQAIINAEYEHILDLGTAITAAQQGTIQEFRDTFRSRIDMWVNRYTDVKNQAKIYFGGKTRLEWVEGDTKEKCPTCLALNGIVALAQEWEQSGVRPQSPPNNTLECGGWNCQCTLQVTDKRRSPMALQRIMDIATSANVGKSYNPSQPRVPAGDSEGGQWTSEESIEITFEGHNINLSVITNPIAYHGTYKDSAQSIRENGFNVSQDGTAGRGVYLTSNSNDAIYERDPNRSEAVQLHNGKQPDEIIKTQILGKVLDVGTMESGFGPSIYLKPNIYAAYVLEQKAGRTFNMGMAYSDPLYSSTIIQSHGFSGISWKFADGRSAIIVFDPKNIIVK